MSNNNNWRPRDAHGNESGCACPCCNEQPELLALALDIEQQEAYAHHLLDVGRNGGLLEAAEIVREHASRLTSDRLDVRLSRAMLVLVDAHLRALATGVVEVGHG